jgi:hypothetical protein
MMNRTQIALDSEIQRNARERAAQLGISLAEYIRRLINSDLGDRGPQANPSILFDLGDSGATDIARDKDRLLGEAVASTQPRKTPSR